MPTREAMDGYKRIPLGPVCAKAGLWPYPCQGWLELQQQGTMKGSFLCEEHSFQANTKPAPPSPEGQRADYYETIGLGFQPMRVENHATHLISFSGSHDGKTLIIHAKPEPLPNTLQEEPRCHICRGTKSQCMDNEYCQNPWYAAAPKVVDSKEEQDEWRQCMQCGRENSVKTWEKFGNKCPNCNDIWFMEIPPKVERSAEVWNWHDDPIGQGDHRTELRVNFAMDLADPHAPDQIALILRIDLMRITTRMHVAEARAEAWHPNKRTIVEAEFKNFHRSLCARFGYCHDETDWKRDQVSLEEHIASLLAKGSPSEGTGWISVQQELPPLDAENCCMDEADYGRFSDAVIVFDEDEAVITSAVYDDQKQEWTDARNGGEMFGITHWRKIEPPPDLAPPVAPPGEGSEKVILDLHRLKTYINERVKESRRLEQSSLARTHEAMARSHAYSAAVGEDILREISELAPPIEEK